MNLEHECTLVTLKYILTPLRKSWLRFGLARREYFEVLSLSVNNDCVTVESLGDRNNKYDIIPFQLSVIKSGYNGRRLLVIERDE